MKALRALALLLIGACSWSNSLYQARAVSAEALKAEREDRPGDAANAWGRAAFKAESAYVRSPAGAGGRVHRRVTELGRSGLRRPAAGGVGTGCQPSLKSRANGATSSPAR